MNNLTEDYDELEEIKKGIKNDNTELNEKLAELEE